MSDAAPDAADRRFMEQALALAALGAGGTSPNPRVGCVLVRDGRPVGRGFHVAAGLPHAEAVALAEAGERARGATLFINLEPCAHHGRTPPCAEMLVAGGIRRVVAAVRDPNPLVDGRGFRQLERAGITVRTGLLAEQARELNAGFFQWHAHARPLVTLKAAVSLDGMLSAAGGNSRWITGEAARRFAHRLRLGHDAVLVGAGTVRRDDPRLTVRLPGVRAPRLRAVLAPTLDVDPGSRVFDRASDGEPRARVYTAEGAPAAAAARLAERADVVRVASSPAGLDLEQVLDDLGRLEIQSVLVEGGGRTFASLLDAGLADRAALFVAPRLLGARGGTPLVDGCAAERPGRGWWIVERERLPLGSDRVLRGILRRAVDPAPTGAAG